MDTYQAIVDAERCNGCGECVDICPVDSFVLKAGIANQIYNDECVGCEICVETCKVEAIKVISR